MTTIDSSTPVVNMMINLSAIQVDNTANSRTTRDETALAELAASMKKEGLLQPVRVERLDDNRYSLVYGYRRVEAASRLGWTQIRAEVVGPMTPADRAIVNLLENIGRENLSTYDLAMAFSHIQEHFSLSGSVIAGRTGKTTAYVNSLIRIATNIHESVLARWKLECSPEFGKDLETGKRLPNVHAVCSVDWLSKMAARVPKHEQEHEMKLVLGMIDAAGNDIGDNDDSADDSNDSDGEENSEGPKVPKAPKRVGIKTMSEMLEVAETAAKDANLSDADLACVKAIAATLRYTTGKRSSINVPVFKRYLQVEAAKEAKAAKAEKKADKTEKTEKAN